MRPSAASVIRAMDFLDPTPQRFQSTRWCPGPRRSFGDDDLCHKLPRQRHRLTHLAVPYPEFPIVFAVAEICVRVGFPILRSSCRRYCRIHLAGDDRACRPARIHDLAEFEGDLGTRLRPRLQRGRPRPSAAAGRPPGFHRKATVPDSRGFFCSTTATTASPTNAR
jgi:hypothetical protein